MCAWIYVADSTHTTEPKNREHYNNMTTYSPTKLDEDVVSNSFHY